MKANLFTYAFNKRDYSLGETFNLIKDYIALHKYSSEDYEQMHERINVSSKDRSICFKFLSVLYEMYLKGEL